MDPLIPEILDHLRRGRSLVLLAPPGAGKTTRVPPALMALAPGEVWVLEPRRLAARMAARRVASELGDRVGETAGHQVPLEPATAPRTRTPLMPETLLTPRLL